MSKLELDDQILNHPKFIRARKLGGSEAIDLWLGIRAYCGQYLTDGFLPADMVDEVRGPLDPKKRANALKVLVEVRLLDTRDDGWTMHDFLDWSRSKSQVIADRARARERQALSRGASRRDNKRDTGGSNGSSHTGSNGDSHGGSNAGSSGRVTMASASASASEISDSPPTGARARPADPLAESLTTPADELPENWQPNDANRKLAAQFGLNLDDELGEYSAQRRREGYRCGNWDADFELWLRRSKRWARERKDRGSGGTKIHGGPSEDWPTDADISLREAIRGGQHGAKLKAKLEAGQLDAGLARRLVRERESERQEHRQSAEGDSGGRDLAALTASIGRSL